MPAACPPAPQSLLTLIPFAFRLTPSLLPQNDYKTLDPTFMESVWWVFKQLFDKGLVYRGFKVRCPCLLSSCCCLRW